MPLTPAASVDENVHAAFNLSEGSGSSGNGKRNEGPSTETDDAAEQEPPKKKRRAALTRVSELGP